MKDYMLGAVNAAIALANVDSSAFENHEEVSKNACEIADGNTFYLYQGDLVLDTVSYDRTYFQIDFYVTKDGKAAELHNFSNHTAPLYDEYEVVKTVTLSDYQSYQKVLFAVIQALDCTN